MKLNDKQLGKPGILYKDTKTNISGLTPEAGSVAFATDTGELGYYTGTAWVWINPSGGGAQYISDLLDVSSYSPYGEDRDSFLMLNPTGDSVIFQKPLNTVFLYNDFFYNNVASFYPFYGVAISSGTFSVAGASANHPGVIRFTASTTANSGYRVQTANQFYLTPASVPFVRFYFVFLPSSNTGSLVRAGFHDGTTSTQPANGAYIEYNGSAPYIRAVLSVAGTHTYSNSITASYNTWYKLMLTIYSNEVRLSVLDSTNTEVTVESIFSTNRPSGGLYAGAVLTSSVTSQVIASIDYMGIYYTVNR